jgi:hypothetical protein
MHIGVHARTGRHAGGCSPGAIAAALVSGG